MKKRSFALLIVAVLIVCIIGAVLHKKEENQAITIGICEFMQHDSLDAATQGFKAALVDKLGDSVVFHEQSANGDLTMCTMVINDFISKDVDLILANSTNSLQSAAAATTEIPILGTAITEYGAALQLSDFDGTVGGNVSGTSDMVSPDEQAAMIQELFPDAGQIGMLYCSSEPNSQYQVDMLTQALESMGYRCKPYLFVDSNTLSSVTAAAASECDVLYIPTDNTVASNAELIENICAADKVPVITGDESTCRVCGVATLSVDYYDLGYTTGEMAVRILTDGADISDMPVEYASKFTKKYNRAMCETLGLKIPDDYVPLTVEP